VVPPFVSHIENFWDQPDCASWFARLGSFARVAVFDKRGTGMSDRVADLPGLDQRMDDVRAVMDAAGMERAAVLGISEGGPLACLFAASQPQRCHALVLYGSFARFSSWLPTAQALQAFIGYIGSQWGSGGSLGLFAPSRASDPAFQAWWGRFERLGASPSAAIALMRMNSQIDVSDVAAAVHVPTLVIHRRDDVTIAAEGGRLLAERIAPARYLELPGRDHLPFVGDNTEEILDAIEEFLTGSVVSRVTDRVLATVLFLDLQGSTERAASLGDRRWGELLNAHLETVRRELARFRGRELDTAGDGLFASFDAPARAIRCAMALSVAARRLGLQARVGVHTGECEVIGEKLGGIAVHIGARVSGLAGADQVLVTGTVRDLVAGSGIRFEDRGEHRLKGVPGEWRLFAVEPAPEARHQE
jgi:class 3 adenylate cyclase